MIVVLTYHQWTILILTGLSDCYAPVICNHGPYEAREQRWYLYIFAKPGYMPSTAGTFLWSKPCKKACSNPGMQMWNYLGCLGMRIKSPLSMVPRHCGDDFEVKTWHLTPAMSPAPMGRAYKWQVHNAHHFSAQPQWGRDSDQSSLCTQRVAKDPSFSSCGHQRLWSDWMPRLILVFAGRTSLVLSCTGCYPILSHYQCQQTWSIHDEYSWYLSRQTSISIHPAFLRNKSIAYLENIYWTDLCHSACKSKLLFLPEAATTVTVHI